MRQIKVFFLLLLLATGNACFAQDSIPSEIKIEERGDSMHFSSHLRPLRQIVGAPPCFYSYFWELGDGRFSFDREPVYAYRDTGVYQVRLYATNNYDDGKAPPTRPHPVKIRKKALSRDAWASHFFHGSGEIEMKINRYPRPGENFVTVIGYRNRGSDSLGGSIVLFYNERQLGQEGFALADRRFYNREEGGSLESLMAGLATTETRASLAAGAREGGVEAGRTGSAGSGAGGWAISWRSTDGDRTRDRGWEAEEDREVEGQAAGSVLPDEEDAAANAAGAQSMLRSLEGTYSQHTVLHFPALGRGEEKYVFVEMNTLPGMLQDTNATVGFSAMLVPDDPRVAPEVYQMDMVVVASHDPNRFLFRSRRINYRFMGKKKELSYRVQFQNTGNGPTRRIAIGIGIPPQLDPGSFTLQAVSPACPFCHPGDKSSGCIDTIHRNDSVYIVFNNIYLPGLQQQGIADKDSTEGFVDYTIRFRKKPRKIPFSTQASIVFDHHTPVLTNKATARFIKGLSPGFMAGYGLLPGSGGYSASGPLQFGYVLAPYAPSRPYFQIEAFVGFLQQDAFTSVVVQDQKDTLIAGLPVVVTGRQTKTTTQRNSFEVTPLHYRYNLSNWIGVGAGAMVQVNISEQTTTENRVYFNTPALPLNIMTAASTQQSAVTYLGSWNAAPFVDVQVGRVRQGPVLGIRYFKLLKGDLTDRFFLYAGFKL
ncbi:MAG TPA: PKD domain-containing protein [Puia sp.]|nr:PKD domain-containing protein [Puia sp.]